VEYVKDIHRLCRLIDPVNDDVAVGAVSLLGNNVPKLRCIIDWPSFSIAGGQ
jgi:hypothetical protein